MCVRSCWNRILRRRRSRGRHISERQFGGDAEDHIRLPLEFGGLSQQFGVLRVEVPHHLVTLMKFTQGGVILRVGLQLSMTVEHRAPHG